MKEQMFAVQLQSQTTHAFCIYHLQQKHFKLLSLITQKQLSCKKGVSYVKKTA